jgi:tripeptide aminopeptidase
MTSPLSSHSGFASAALERFLRYVRIDTQADPTSTTVPSTAKQLDLSRLLVSELRELGLADAELDEHGYVLATLPATVDRDVPTIALLAHVDVAFDAPADGVQPQVIRYAGGRVPLPGDPSVALDPAVSPKLADHVGHELVTSDGTTLLGADNKAGVAEIMTVVAHLIAHPELQHGPIRICFTRDEEIGKGVEQLELERLGADAAYTIDGSTLGQIENETFGALEATVTFHGIAVHPGNAKGRMVNAGKLAADFVASLPRDALSPETTEGREGFVNPMSISGGEARRPSTSICATSTSTRWPRTSGSCAGWPSRRSRPSRARGRRSRSSRPTATCASTCASTRRWLRPRRRPCAGPGMSRR